MAPGAPDNITIIASGIDFLSIQARLPTTGTPPFDSIHFVISSPEGVTSIYNVTEGNLTHGEVVTAQVGGLMPDTVYSVFTFVMNAAGRGLSSETATSSTCKIPIMYVATLYGGLRIN